MGGGRKGYQDTRRMKLPLKHCIFAADCKKPVELHEICTEVYVIMRR